MPKKKSKLLTYVIILSTINLAFIAGIIFFITQLPKKATQLKELKNQTILNQKSQQLKQLQNQISQYKTKIDTIESYYTNEEGLITFTDNIDQLKKEGIVTHFSFASNNVIKDSDNYLGIPFVIEFQGNTKQINQALLTIQNLPFLVRTLSFNLQDNSNKVILKYGGILYVNEQINN